MALSKPLSHLKTLTLHRHHRPILLPHLHLRLLSFATPEEAAAERRRRKRRLRIEPPLNSLRHSQPPRPPQQQHPRPSPNPNAPKLPEPVSALSGKRLDLHNRILTLIRENDLDEASLLVRHSIYSNCRPTVFTCNAVLSALLRQSRYPDFLTLHRFITQAGVAPSIITHNLLFSVYCDCKKTDTALEHFRAFVNTAPFGPSPTTYRILVKGLVDNDRLDQAVELKNDMLGRNLSPDPVVYNYLMSGFLKNGEPDKVLEVYEEMQGERSVFDGTVCGNLMKGYFGKGLEAEAMRLYEDSVLSGKVRFGAGSYNSVLDALSKNGKHEEALGLFERMKSEHNPPRRLTVNLGSFNVVVDLYCDEGRFDDAIEVFRGMGEKKCSPDTMSYNNLIEQLSKNGRMGDAEGFYGEMGERGVNPDEFTYVILVDACFEEGRVDDAVAYFEKLCTTEKLRPNVAAHNKMIHGMIKAGEIDRASGYFDQMAERELEPDFVSFDSLLRAYCDAGRLDEAFGVVKGVFWSEKVEFGVEMEEVVREALRREGRDEEAEMKRVREEFEKEKEEKERRDAEEKARADALAREEEERKKAEAAAKEAAAAKASAAAIEAILGRRKADVGEQNSETSEVLNGGNAINGVNGENEVPDAEVIDGEKGKDGDDAEQVSA
ncbi:Pentatricopeptide repeat-containing protein [Acorus calamus]|uniref:Pentatricopeptide repeat-containing protein n=1 Tax=Acorus calamus TaxID=4465 RepID=A0AAV9C8C1_ACOCL|nr:Pentatricopeptide repeat-containing protein [Acorus calamus]